MFCIIPANRACLTDFATISPTQFAFSFPSAPTFSHLVVFILPRNTLPPGTAAGVYLQLPGLSEIRFLGAIGNEKPSAIFKVNLPAPKAGADVGLSTDADAMTDVTETTTNNTSFTTPPTASSPSPSTTTGNQPGCSSSDIILGISVEPVANIQAQLATVPSPSQFPSTSNGRAPVASPDAIVVYRPPPEMKLLAQRIIKDAFNFLASFAGSVPGGQEVVPLKSFQDWWTKFERKLENDPQFLEKRDG